MSNDLKASGSLGFRFVKRTFDIICSVILMIPIGIVIGISYFFIKAEDRGSVFYMAERTGRFGKPFKMYKLRSMKENAPDIRLADGSTYNGEDDPRVTKFGKFARKTSIDELPQVINILKGDMSFIGPRPDTPMYLDKYTEEERIVLTVRPGITGYNQAVNRNSVLLVLSDEAEFCYKVNDFYHPNDEGGMAWNDPEIGIEWPELKGEYKGSASAEGYTLADGTALILSDKDQKWMGLKDTFKF